MNNLNINATNTNAALNEDLMSIELLANPVKKADAMSIVSSAVSSSKKKRAVVDKKKKTSVSSEDDDDTVSELDDEIMSVLSSVSSAAAKKKDQPQRQRAKSSSSASSSASVVSSADTSSSDASSDTVSDISNLSKVKRMSQDDIINTKRELLYQFDRLEKKGVKLPKKFSMASNVDEMRAEYERLKKDREVDVAIQFQRQALMTCVSGIEFLNSKFDPFDIKLDGWSSSVNSSINNYDDVFEELYEKYRGKGSMAPEMRLMMSLAGSAFMFHLTNTMFKASLPGMESIPASATATASKGGGKSGGFMSNMFGGLMGSLFGGGGGGGGAGGILSALGKMGGGGDDDNNDGPRFDPSRVTQPSMRGPDMDTILDDIEIASILKEDRVDTMSTVSESEMSSINGGRNGDIKGVFVETKGRRGSSSTQKKPTMVRKTINI